MKFQDRLNTNYFEGDEPVGIAAVVPTALPGPIESKEWQYIPERLWNRLLCLGQAYELHFAQVIEPVIDTTLDASQCQSLIEEITFLASVVDDTALRSAIHLILSQAEQVVRGGRGRLVFSSP